MIIIAGLKTSNGGGFWADSEGEFWGRVHINSRVYIQMYFIYVFMNFENIIGIYTMYFVYEFEKLK